MQSKIKQKNTMITTREGNKYQIISELGKGSMSVVYRADRIINDAKHPVLVKSFIMPEDNDKPEEFRNYVKKELDINQEIIETEFAGAMTISYSEHGQDDDAIYGIILNICSGMTLREYVSREEYEYMSLKEKIILIKHLSQLVKNFHKKCGMIHGDITPDNIYVLDTANREEGDYGTDVALYDFGSAQHIQGEEDIDMPLRATDGYAVQDILQGTRKRLTEGDDWYAVQSCAWFCLSKKDKTDFEITEENIDSICRQYAVNYEKNGFAEKNSSATDRLIQSPLDQGTIMEKIKKLFLNPDDNGEKFFNDLQNIGDVLDKTGINRTMLYENLKKDYKERYNDRFNNLNIIHKILPKVHIDLPKNLPHFFRVRGSDKKVLQDIMEDKRDSLFLIGDGGMGKTTSLIDIMNEAYRNDQNTMDDENKTFVVFIELCTLSQDFKDWHTDETGATFLEQFLASYFLEKMPGFVEKTHPYVMPLKKELFRTPQNGRAQYTFLLDGLNEIWFINKKSKKYFFEGINQYITHAKNIRIVMTSRSDACELTTDGLLRLKAMGLNEECIKNVLEDAVKQEILSLQEYKNILEKKNILYSSESRLWQCLKIPFFLMMYCVVSEKKDVSSQGEILKNFFQNKRETLDGQQTFGENTHIYNNQKMKKNSEMTDLRMDLPIKVVLDLIIPEIALDMAIHNHFFISPQNMIQIADDHLHQTFQKNEPYEEIQQYYDYSVNIRELLKVFSQYTDRLPEIACSMLGIMRKSSGGTYFFTHQYIRDYFAASAIIHRMLKALGFKRCQIQDIDAEKATFSEIVSPLHQHEISVSVSALIGEILDEKKNLPVYDAINKTWHYVGSQTLKGLTITRFLDFYRNIHVEEGDPAHLGLRNVISILKNSRRHNDGRADLSGMDLKNLNLQGISLYGVVLSHFGEDIKNVYCTDFSESEHVLEAIFQDDTKDIVRCYGIHPDQKCLVCWNKANGQVSEFDMEEMATKNLFEVKEDVKAAFYTEDPYDIWLVGVAESGRKPSGERRKNTQKKNNNAGIKIYYYNRDAQKSISRKFDNEEFLDVTYSREFHQLSLFIKTDNTIKLKIMSVKREKNKLTEKSFDVEEKGLYIKISDCQKISCNTFMHCRLNASYYLISDIKIQNGCIGKWNIQDGGCQTFCYVDPLSSGEMITAFCNDPKNGKVYYLKDGIDPVGFINVEKSDNEQKLKNEMYIHLNERMEFIENKNELLILSGDQLKLVDMDENIDIWKCDLKIEDFYLEHNILVVNTYDGIYEVDLFYGGYTCLYRFQDKEIQFVLGQTSTPELVVLYESTGIMKWIHVKTGCCERHVILQIPNTDIEQIYCDCSDWIIYGISGQRIYVWNAVSGVLMKDYNITYNSDDWQLQFCTFGSIQKVQVYFETKNYNVFPLIKEYFVMEWDLKGEDWVNKNTRDYTSERPFRKVLSFHGQSPYVLEIEQESSDQKNNSLVTKKSERFISFFKKFLQKTESVDDFDLFDEIESRKPNIYWQTPSKIMKIKEKKICFGDGSRKLQPLAVVGEDHQIIGVTTDKNILYIKEDDLEKIDLRIGAGEVAENIQLPDLYSMFIENTFISGDTFVAIGKSISKGFRVVLFWDTKEKDGEIYCYYIRKNIIAAGCKIDCTVDREEKKLLKREGILEAERTSFGRVKRIKKKTHKSIRSISS